MLQCLTRSPRQGWLEGPWPWDTPVWLLVAKKYGFGSSHTWPVAWGGLLGPHFRTGRGIPPLSISLLPSATHFETPAMLVILLEWEQAVYNFPSDCYKSKAKTPTSGGTGSCPGALVAT